MMGSVMSSLDELGVDPLVWHCNHCGGAVLTSEPRAVQEHRCERPMTAETMAELIGCSIEDGARVLEVAKHMKAEIYCGESFCRGVLDWMNEHGLTPQEVATRIDEAVDPAKRIDRFLRYAEEPRGVVTLTATPDGIAAEVARAEGVEGEIAKAMVDILGQPRRAEDVAHLEALRDALPKCRTNIETFEWKNHCPRVATKRVVGGAWVRCDHHATAVGTRDLPWAPVVRELGW